MYLVLPYNTEHDEKKNRVPFFFFMSFFLKFCFKKPTLYFAFRGRSGEFELTDPPFGDFPKK